MFFLGGPRFRSILDGGAGDTVFTFPQAVVAWDVLVEIELQEILSEDTGISTLVCFLSAYHVVPDEKRDGNSLHVKDPKNYRNNLEHVANDLKSAEHPPSYCTLPQVSRDQAFELLQSKEVPVEKCVQSPVGPSPATRRPRFDGIGGGRKRDSDTFTHKNSGSCI